MKRFLVSLASVAAVLCLNACGAVMADEVGDGKSTTKTPTPTASEPKGKYCAPDDKDCDGVGRHKPDGSLLDCNDENPDMFPTIPDLDYEAEEICNGFDDNCNGQTDEGYERTTFYKDADGDEYGDSAVSQKACKGSPPAGYVEKGGDCNDDPATGEFTHPGAEDKSLDGSDQNCDDHAPATASEPKPEPESSDETEEPAAKPGSLTVSTTTSNRLELTYHLFASYADIGKGWDIDEPFVADWDDSVTASIPDVSKACGLRIGLTIGSGSTKSWGCQGGQVNEIIEAVDLTLGEEATKDVATSVWIDPEGGCGIYVTWGDACAAP